MARAAVAEGWTAAPSWRAARVEPMAAPPWEPGSGTTGPRRTGRGPFDRAAAGAEGAIAVAAPGAALQGRLPSRARAHRERSVPARARKLALEAGLGDPAVQANFVELRRLGSELADVDAALVMAEDAWLALAERAPR